MKRQTLIALAAAIMLGLVAVYLANIFLSSSKDREAAGEMTQVAVAAVPLDYGVEVTPDKIRFAAYPKSSLPAGSYQTPAQLFAKGERRVALMAIGINEPILSSKISGEGKNASIAALLPDGMRAASVRINDVSGVAGFVQPNDSVDVLVTRQMTGTGNNQQFTDVLLQDARVIAIDQDSAGADGKPMLAKSATLEVDPIGAQKLALAQEVGSLSLVLRKPGTEQNNPLIETVSLNDLRYNVYRGYRPPVGASPAAPRSSVAVVRRRPAPVARKAPPPPARSNVEVVRGTTGNDYQVGDYDS